MRGFDAAQRAYDNMTPDEYDNEECPECGADLEEDSDGYKCTECDYSIYPPGEDDCD